MNKLALLLGAHHDFINPIVLTPRALIVLYTSLCSHGVKCDGKVDYFAIKSLLMRHNQELFNKRQY